MVDVDAPEEIISWSESDVDGKLGEPTCPNAELYVSISSYYLLLTYVSQG